LQGVRMTDTPAPTIYVDADACPVVVREMLFRAAQRTGVALVLVANQSVNVPRAPNIRAVRVAGGFDVADAEIAGRVAPGDLVVTADLPLAADAIARGAQVVTPRGEVLDAGNVRARLGMRDFLDTLRGSGIHSGGPPPLGERDKRAFAAVLDRYLAALPRRAP
jgi:uncharacterized protein